MTLVKNKLEKLELLSALMVDAALKSGLTWDESLVAFGMSAKKLATISALIGDGDTEGSCRIAGRLFHEGLAHDVVVDIGSCTLH
jgi:hypothetical protein